MPTFRKYHARSIALRLASASLVGLVLSTRALAQGGMGGGGQNTGSTTPPAASAPLKKNADRTDPVNFLLDRKKPLEISKPVEDSLKHYRGEMRHMQDVVFKDLDKAATKKDNGQPPSDAVLLQLSTDAAARVQDIQDAYRDRSRLLMSDRQRQQVDSMEAIWKRAEDNNKSLAVPGKRRLPPPRDR
jgi:hypothetical protein